MIISKGKYGKIRMCVCCLNSIILLRTLAHRSDVFALANVEIIGAFLRGEMHINIDIFLRIDEKHVRDDIFVTRVSDFNCIEHKFSIINA